MAPPGTQDWNPGLAALVPAGRLKGSRPTRRSCSSNTNHP